MPVCSVCKENRETPDSASLITQGGVCGRCGSTYAQDRAYRAEDENKSLEDYLDADEEQKREPRTRNADLRLLWVEQDETA